MATDNLYANMLNQYAIKPPKLKTPGISVKKAPGTPQFAYIDAGNYGYRHPMTNRGTDVSQSVWGKMLGLHKGKGVKKWPTL